MSSTLTQSQAMARLNSIRNAEGWKRQPSALDSVVQSLPKWEVSNAER